MVIDSNIDDEEEVLVVFILVRLKESRIFIWYRDIDVEEDKV